MPVGIPQLKSNFSYPVDILPIDTYKNRRETVDNSKQYEEDILFGELKDLVTEEFRAWYIKCFYKLGRKKTLELASQAIAEGKDKKKLFSYLLKKEVARA